MISRLEKKYSTRLGALAACCGKFFGAGGSFQGNSREVSVLKKTNCRVGRQCRKPVVPGNPFSGAIGMKPMAMRWNVLLWLSMAAMVCLMAAPAEAADPPPDGVRRE